MANLILSPEDFTTSWTESGTSVVSANTDTAPDGTVTVDTVTDDNAGGFESIVSSTMAISANATHTLSAFIKKDSTAASTRYPLFRVTLSGGTTNRFDGAIDTSTGAVDSNVALGSGTIDSIIAEDFDANFWRFIMTFTDSQSNTSSAVTLFPAVNAGTLNAAIFSAAATGSTKAWGVYLNTGSSAEDYVSQAGIALPLSGLQLVRNVTRSVTKGITRGVSG